MHKIIAVLEVDRIMANSMQGNRLSKGMRIRHQNIKSPGLELVYELQPVLQLHLAHDKPCLDSGSLQQCRDTSDGILENAPYNSSLSFSHKFLYLIDARLLFSRYRYSVNQLLDLI